MTAKTTDSQIKINTENHYIDCYGKNSIQAQIKICCDSRHDNCPYFKKLETNECEIKLCLINSIEIYQNN